MLAKAHRLDRTEFSAIPKGTKGYSGKFMKIIPMFVSTADAKMGIIASRKQFPTAVERNYARRRVYAAFARAGFTDMQGLRVLVLGRTALSTVSFEELYQEVCFLLRRSGISPTSHS